MRAALLFLILAILIAAPCLGQASMPSPAAGPKPPDKTKHPLDPLSADEIRLATQILKDNKAADRRALYSYIGLQEPDKAAVLAYKSGDPFDRRARAIFYEPASNDTVEAVVDLGRKTVESRRVAGRQGQWNRRDDALTERIVRVDPRWQAAVRKHGFDPVDVGVGAGPNRGYVDAPQDGARYVLAQTFLDDPVDSAELNILALVNLTKRKVEWVRDAGGSAVRADSDQFPGNPDLTRETRPAPNPLKVTMPKGATFTMEGNEVRWQNWRFRIGYDPRVGLILYTVGWEDATRVRPIMYRGSLSELYVPYGDPNYVMVHWFDAGEFGLGTAFDSSFAPMNDAPENAKLLPAVVNDQQGRPRTIEGAIAVYERDGGILWRHGGDSRGARDLVLASMHRAGNYDYCFQWIFHQDGTLAQDVVLSGYMETKNVERKKDPENGVHSVGDGSVGTLVAPNVEATNHQHFLCFRLDMDVDGPAKNEICECNTEGLPGDGNLLKNAIVMRETPLMTETAAQRDVNIGTHRCWKIVNPTVRNSLNQPSAYMLMPGETAVPYALPDSFLRKVSAFTEHQLWVTPYDPVQLYAAGEYVFDGAPDDGLKKWTAGNRSLEDADLVLYYTVGVTHVPRVEDWPYMSAHHAGFMLMPAGFFSSNPAMGVPRTKP